MTRENVSECYPCLAALLSNCFMKSTLDGTRDIESVISVFSNFSCAVGDFITYFASFRLGDAYVTIAIASCAFLVDFRRFYFL